MALLTKPYTFVNGTTAMAPEVNADFDTLYGDYNGNISNVNIAANAGIADTKLAPITSILKVNGNSLYGLNSINSSAGIIPVANIPTGTAAFQVVELDAAAKLPAVDGSQLTNFQASQIPSLSGAIITSGTVGVAYLPTGTGPNQIVELNGSSQLPAVDGSLLTGLPLDNRMLGILISGIFTDF